MSKSDDLEDFCIDLDEIEVEEESLVQIRKQLLLTQQFRIDQERKNATISSLKRRIESLEDEKSASYAEVGELRIKLRDKETIESKLSSITIELEESTDKYACLLLENENLREEMKSLQNRYDKLKISHYKSQERENELSINIASLEKYINELRSDISKKDKEYLHHEKQVTIHLEKLDNEKLSQQQRVTFLEEEVEAQLATIKDYENGNRNLELSLKHAESVRVALKDELQEQQEEIEAYAEKNAQLETVLNSIRHELSSLASAHKHEMHAMQVRIDQCNNDYMDQKNETAKYKMMLGSIGTAVEKHYEYDDMVQQRSDKSDSRTSHHDGDGNRYVPYSTIMSQSNENKQSSYRRNEPVDAKYEEMMRKTVRNYEKNSNINQSTKKLNEDQEVAAMVCKLLSENHHVKQENIVLTNKLNSCFEDINRKQSHIQRIELEHNWLLNSMEELDDVIYDFEKRLSNDDVVYIQMHAMSGNGNSANVSFNQDNEEQQGIHTAENMEPQSETLEKESFIGTNGKKINKKHASNTHKKHYATSTISSQHMFPNSSSVHPTSNNPNGANTNRSKSPNIVESNHATNRSRSNSMEKSTATGTSKHAPTSTETHEINYSNISDSNLAKIVQHRKNRIQILQEAYNKLVNCCESFIVSENEKAEEISNLEEQLQSQSKLQLLLVKKQENDVSDLKLKYEETIREWTAKYYQQIDAMSEANEHAEMAVRTVTEEAQIEMEFLTKKFKENMGETNTYLEQEHVKEINALKKKHVTHVEDICSILIYVLFCYMKLYANYYEVVIQKSIYFQMSRRSDQYFHEIDELHKWITRNAIAADAKANRDLYVNAPTNRNMSFLDDDYEAERTKYTDPHTMKHTNIRKVSFRTIALVVLITCHFRKLSRYNQTTVHSKKKNTGNKKSKPIATDKSSSDIGCLQPIELLRHTTIDTSAVEQCQGAWEIGNNSIGLTNYMRKRRFSQYESPITVSLLLLERECDSSFSILNWKNCVLKQFNAMGSSFATSNSRFHMNSSATDGSSLLEAVVYQPSNRVRMHRTGHQTLDIIQNMRASLAVWNEQIRQTVVKNNELGNTLSSYEVKQSLQEKLLAEARASLKEQQHMVDRYKQQKLKEETDILSAIKKVHRAASGGDVSPIRETKSYFTPNSYTKTRKFQMNVVNSGHKPPPRSPERHSETKRTPISPIPVHPVRDETADFDDMMDAYLPNRFENSNS